MSKKYRCPKCFHFVGNSLNVYEKGSVCPSCGVDLSKYAVRYGRDFGDRTTMGELVDGVIELVLKKESNEVLADYIDQKFLWGAWGHIIGTVDDVLFIKDLRGVIVAACERSLDLNRKIK